MNVTLETPAAEIRPVAPVLPVEAAADVPPAERLDQEPDREDSAEPGPAQAGEIDPRVAAERHALRERIRQSSHLSRGMRDRLSALLEGEPASAGEQQPLIRAADALALLEEAIPSQLGLDPQSLARPEHPAGEVFFTGDANQMSDEQAERIAHEQISRSAFGSRG